MQDTQDGTEGRLSSVASAIRVLKAFSETEVEIGISTLAKRLGLAKSTVHRLASTLTAEGLLEQNSENGRYRLGLGLFALGALVRRRMDISTQALPYLHELREITGETVHLATLEQSNIIYLFNLESHQAIRMRSYVGARKPAFCTSEGRVLLAFQSPEVLARVVLLGAGVPPEPGLDVQDRALELGHSPTARRCRTTPTRRKYAARQSAMCLAWTLSSRASAASWLPTIASASA